jgi:TIR domain/Restriction endonuclease
MTKDAPDTKPRVFLSYASADKAAASKIADILRESGLRVAVDSWELRPGDSLRSRIDESVTPSDYLIVLLSPHSVESKWVRSEWNSMFSNRLRHRAVGVLPAMIESCRVPDELSWRPYLDLRHNFESGVRELAGQLGALREVDFSKLDRVRFQDLVKDLLNELGFLVRPTHGSRDTGVDLVAIFESRDPFGAEQRDTWFVEIKHYRDERVSVSALQQMLGYLLTSTQIAKGLMVTSAQLTSVAREFLSDATARTGHQLRVIDRTELTNLLIRHPRLVAKYFDSDDEPSRSASPP